MEEISRKIVGLATARDTFCFPSGPSCDGCPVTIRWIDFEIGEVSTVNFWGYGDFSYSVSVYKGFHKREGSASGYALWFCDAPFPSYFLFAGDSREDNFTAWVDPSGDECWYIYTDYIDFESVKWSTWKEEEEYFGYLEGRVVDRDFLRSLQCYTDYRNKPVYFERLRIGKDIVYRIKTNEGWKDVTDKINQLPSEPIAVLVLKP